MSLNLRNRSLTLAIIANLFWSSSYTFQEIASKQFDLLFILFIRFFLAALSTYLICLILKVDLKIPISKLLYLCILALLVYLIAPFLQIFAVSNLGAIHVGLFIALEPLFAIFISLFVLKETWERIHSLSLGIILISLLAPIFWEGQIFLDIKLPYLLILSLALFLEGLQGPILKPMLNNRIPALTLAMYAYTFAAILCFISLFLAPIDFELIQEQIKSANNTEIFSLFYLALICTTIAYSLWYMAFEHIEVSHASMMIYIQPLASTVFAIIILGSWPNSTEWVSLIILLFGLGLFLNAELQRNSNTD